MFKLESCTPVSSDCTQGYNVVLDKEYTVKDFINSVLSKKGEWGYISFGGYQFEYRYGNVLANVPKDNLDKMVLSAKSSGGYSRMDYTLTI